LLLLRQEEIDAVHRHTELEAKTSHREHGIGPQRNGLDDLIRIGVAIGGRNRRQVEGIKA
jgi:hypothetical protein